MTPRKQTGWCDPKIVEAPACFGPANILAPGRAVLTLKNPRMGQRLAADILSTDGVTPAPTGTRLTAMALEKIRNMAELTGVREPIGIERESR